MILKFMWILVSSIDKVFLLSNKRFGSSSSIYTNNQLVFWLDDKKQLLWSGHYKLKFYHIYQKRKKRKKEKKKKITLVINCKLKDVILGCIQ